MCMFDGDDMSNVVSCRRGHFHISASCACSMVMTCLMWLAIGEATSILGHGVHVRW